MTAVRAFHALNGLEVRTRLIQETLALLQGDTRFGPDQGFPSITWRWVMTLEAYPMEPATMTVSVQGAMMDVSGADVQRRIAAQVRAQIDADTRFGQHITFPKVTWSISLSADIPRENAVQPVARTVQIGDREIDLTGLDKPRDVSVDPLAAMRAVETASAAARPSGAAALTGVVLDSQGRPIGGPVAVDPNIVALTQIVTELKQEMRAMREGVAGVATPERQHEIIDHTRVPVRNVTGTGLEITGGPKDSPGPAAELARSWGEGAAAMAAVERAGSATVETVELGIEHPALENGGIGAPDRVRRESGMAVPTPVHVPGVGTVDLRGSF